MKSSRRFAGSSGSSGLPDDEPDDPLVFFVDHNLGSKLLPDALRKQGCTVEVHDTHFASGTKDTVWVPDVARRGWIVLSKDLNIASNALERETLFQAGARAFLLSQQNLSGPDQAAAFVRGLRRIRHIALSEPAPFIARVSPSGEVKVLTDLKRHWKRSLRSRGSRT